MIVRQIKTNLKEADRANDHLFDTTPTNSPPRSHQHMMVNGNSARFHENGTRREENSASIRVSQGSSYHKIDEEVEDYDRDDDDELYEHEFDLENSLRGSYGVNGYNG